MKKGNGLFEGISESEQVDDYLKKLKHPLKDVVKQLRELIVGMDDQIGEGVYWNAPAFYFTGKMKPFAPKEFKRYIVGFNLYKKDAIRLIFLRGASVADKSGLLEGDFKDGRRIATFHNAEEVKANEKTLKKIILQLIKQIDK